MRLDFRRAAALSAFGYALVVSALAQEAPLSTASDLSSRHRLRECLAILDLTDGQKTDVENALTAAKPTLQADVAAVTAARQTLKSALEATSPEACAIGTDALALKAAREALRAERQTVINQILAILRTDQQSRLQGCLDAPLPGAAGAADESAD
jgi:Spy/CpxP family protein refolding chaperone